MLRDVASRVLVRVGRERKCYVRDFFMGKRLGGKRDDTAARLPLTAYQMPQEGGRSGRPSTNMNDFFAFDFVCRGDEAEGRNGARVTRAGEGLIAVKV